MRPHLCSLTFILATGFLATVALAQTQPAAAPAQIPINQEFDFWLGDWEVTSADGVVLGWSRIVLQPGRRVLHETWSDTQGGGGNGWLAHNAGGGAWHYVYAGRDGSFAELSGGMVGGKIMLSGTGHLAAKPARQLRITWEAGSDGTVRQVVERSGDGVNWDRPFDGHYRKLNNGQKLFVIVRKRGTGWVAEKQLLDQPDYAGHIAFVRENFRPGAIRHIGQLGAEGTHFQYIVRATDADAARQLIAEDPWDASKVVEIESVRVYTPFFGIP